MSWPELDTFVPARAARRAHSARRERAGRTAVSRELAALRRTPGARRRGARACARRRSAAKAAPYAFVFDGRSCEAASPALGSRARRHDRPAQERDADEAGCQRRVARVAQRRPGGGALARPRRRRGVRARAGAALGARRVARLRTRTPSCGAGRIARAMELCARPGSARRTPPFAPGPSGCCRSCVPTCARCSAADLR